MCSPPSKMLADLEQKWGMTLLERSKSGVCLTSAGEPVRPFLLLEHGDGGKGSRRQHPARPDLAAHPVQNRNPLLQQPYYHPIGLAMKKQAHPTPAVQKFIEK